MKVVLYLVLLCLFARLHSLNAFKCTHEIFCEGPVLKTIQLSGIFNDSKIFVDMPLRHPPADVKAAFDALPDHSIPNLKKFLEENFYEAWSDVKISAPTDWKENPAFLQNIKDNDLLSFAKDVNGVWKTLVKEFDHSFSCSDCFSSIKSKYPFVVPGGRFEEYYYWDNLWIVHGLLVSEMYDTALHTIHNILDNIDKYGFMPNGARIYYLSRSQPPVASIMVRLIYDTIKDISQYKQKAKDLIEFAYPILKKEYEFFMTNRAYEIELNGVKVVLNHFSSDESTPRPESYKEDLELAEEHPEMDATDMMKNIRAGAESGWDFSTRWFQNKSSFATIKASEVLPVDLNAIMLLNEKNMAYFSEMKGLDNERNYFKMQETIRKMAFTHIFYDSEMGEWYDYWYKETEIYNINSHAFYASNFAPIWAFGQQIYTQTLMEAMESIKDVADSNPGGIPSSLINSHQQWDFPNAWPPSQYMLIEGLWEQKDNLQAINLAKEISWFYLRNAYCSWKETKQEFGEGYMFEKYNSQYIGKSGHGGEYEVQTGFGWSNGVLLRILQKYGDQFTAPNAECPVTQKM